MKNSIAFLIGSALVLAYSVYLILARGNTIFLDSVAIPRDSEVGESLLSYPYILDVGFLILGLWMLWRFILLITEVQSNMLQTSLSPYTDIYLMAAFTLTAIIIAFLVIEIGFGLGAAGMVSFFAAYLISSGCFHLYFRRIAS